ncbi:M56 family metallopeptidase [Phenylobacterium sp.]|jgi:beta-lactamase regulating signal transducer with metallopeptidase domain|uniref:M56 family metallopeptidase n=1 Tax=Phenylobacterium sp. TaxID=1871053 RepID=UPI002E2FEBE7|nr:M56 family metallopeptidase [Phenylobacterium sp.]HEX3366155.1 M56 family metallopeptidase [Phenylobacterium sp.]
MSELLGPLLRLNLVAAAAIGIVLVLRVPVRRLFGPRLAYGLWTLAPLAVAAMLAPARTVWLPGPTSAAPTAGPDVLLIAHPGFAPTLRLASAQGLSTALAVIWIAGGLAALLWLAWSQTRFDRAVRAGAAGPAVVGVVRPRIVVPDDFAQHYSPSEQRVVLAHESTHIRRQDSRINALMALARCASWFNPAVHLMAHYLRIDQEFACDAQVMARHPRARRTYGQAMLKTQLSHRPLPLGCYWPAQATHPLVERVRLLSRPRPGVMGRSIGLGLVGLIVLGGAATVWATRPARVVLVAAPPATARPAAGESLAPRSAVATLGPPARLQRISTEPEPEPEPDPVAEAAAEPPANAGMTEATDDPQKAGAGRRLLPPGSFGPLRRIRGLADWSAVEPGAAVRVVATMKDPDGVPLTTDLTAFGSQSRYRLGYIANAPSRYRLFTSVTQHGERLAVTAGLNRSFSPMVSGTIELAAGETGTIALPNGLQITVTPTIRSETPEEIAEARGRARVDVRLAPGQA